MLTSIESASILYSPFWVPSEIALRIAADGAVKGGRATELDHACLLVSYNVLDVAAGVVFATTSYGKVEGDLSERVWGRDSIDIIVEEIERFLLKLKSLLHLQG